MPDYEKFYRDVRQSLKERLQRFQISEEELDSFLKNEEDQVKGEYRHLTEDQPSSADLTEEARYNNSVNRVSMCLEYCF